VKYAQTKRARNPWAYTGEIAQKMRNAEVINPLVKVGKRIYEDVASL
jgi:hypothetical protein